MIYTQGFTKILYSLEKEHPCNVSLFYQRKHIPTGKTHIKEIFLTDAKHLSALLEYWNKQHPSIWEYIAY